MYTSSYDKTIICEDKIIYSSKEWIRCMNENLYGVGKQIIYNGKKIYEHSDWISGVLKINKILLSIGLDGTIMIYNENNTSDIDDEELEKFMNN